MTAISVLVVDDHPVVREGLKMLLRASADVTVSGEAWSSATALEAISRSPPDVVLLDLDLGNEDGLAIVPQLKTLAPRARVLVLTGLRDRARHEAAVLAGARGLVVKDRSPDVLLDAIRKVHAGQMFFDMELLDSTLQRMVGPQHQAEPGRRALDSLTARERDIVGLIGEGLRNAEIGARLGVSEKTIRNHLTTIYDKLGVADRLELLVLAYEQGLVRKPAPR